jgi:hypothetical protein
MQQRSRSLLSQSREWRYGYPGGYRRLTAGASGRARERTQVSCREWRGVDHLYLVGLAIDYCVRHSGLDA